MVTWTSSRFNEAFSSGAIPRVRMAAVRRRSCSESLYLRFCWPIIVALAPSWQSKADEADATRRQNVTTSPDTTGSARRLSSLSLGTHVDVQDPRTKLWDRRGVIVAIGRHRDYYVRMRSGRVYWRNRRFLRPFIPLICSSESSSQTTRTTSTSSQADGPRRSTRTRNAPSRLNISDTSRQSYV